VVLERPATRAQRWREVGIGRWLLGGAGWPRRELEVGRKLRIDAAAKVGAKVDEPLHPCCKRSLLELLEQLALVHIGELPVDPHGKRIDRCKRRSDREIPEDLEVELDAGFEI